MKQFLKKIQKQFRYGEKGFTLIELLVVVAILGVLAAVAVPNVGKFINRGKTEAAQTELHNIQTAVMAMLSESLDGKLTAGIDMTDVTDLSTITAPDPTEDASGANLVLSDYVTGLNGTEVKLPHTYTFTITGAVTQSP